ncbi:hypothetical protein [Synoicihabitans lomoniglobus]|uniref:Ribbon-helix-helix protein, CopG family n=1 Tax=Synoicihabitans lomoniglobus TaxID=2909285 RepID=A0AAE9ZV23_9BACT|nr:hypothetical protein [Opitutaceae bacterium LMO-M01]WED63325.1 hypothetical protein PXH66_13385 [Opitutaceae bacterium LMO-M01]
MPTVRKSLDQARPLSAKQRTRLSRIADKDIDFSDTPEITAAAIQLGRIKLVGRGGVRPGAGRKPSGRKPVSLRLKPSTIEGLHRQAKKEGKTISEVAENRLLAR